MRRSIGFLALLSVLLVLMVACSSTAAPAPAPTAAPAAPAAQAPAAPAASFAGETLRLMTGPMGGSWFPLGGAIAEVLKTELSAELDVQPGAGITNVKAVEAGKTDIGFANACSAADAIAGIAPFESKAKNVRHLMTLYDQVFQMTAPEDTGIKSVADLKGKRVTTQVTGNTGEQMTRHIMEVYGLKYEDLAKLDQVNYNDSVSLVKDRHSDFFSLITTVPAPSITELATSRKMRIIGITEADLAKLKDINSGYVKMVIPKGSYEGQTEEVITYGTYTHLIISAEMADDKVYAITKALAKNVSKLGDVVSAVKGLDVKGMAADVGVPLHPGAEKYYKESGAL